MDETGFCHVLITDDMKIQLKNVQAGDFVILSGFASVDHQGLLLIGNGELNSRIYQGISINLVSNCKGLVNSRCLFNLERLDVAQSQKRPFFITKALILNVEHKGELLIRNID